MNNMPIIFKGSRGKAVEVWQVILNLEPTGYFDDLTMQATEEFQKEHNLVVDGIVEKFTWALGLGTL